MRVNLGLTLGALPVFGQGIFGVKRRGNGEGAFCINCMIVGHAASLGKCLLSVG